MTGQKGGSLALVHFQSLFASLVLVPRKCRRRLELVEDFWLTFTMCAIYHAKDGDLWIERSGVSRWCHRERSNALSKQIEGVEGPTFENKRISSIYLSYLPDLPIYVDPMHRLFLEAEKRSFCSPSALSMKSSVDPLKGNTRFFWGIF